MKKSVEKLFAVTAPGLEEICARELEALDMGKINPVAGGVEFTGGLREIYRSNLWLRSASRILVRLATFKSRDFPDLYGKSVRLPWGRFIPSEMGVQIRVSSQRSRLNHSDRIASTLSAAVDRALGRDATPPSGQQMVLVRFEDDVCQVSIDSSGALLHRRGYRIETAFAPLRENLAAGLLLQLHWDGSLPLFDPMCGSGTLVIEGALLAANRAPGLNRSFAFMDWPGYRSGLWNALCGEARLKEQEVVVPLFGGDREPCALAAAERNAARAGVEQSTRWCQGTMGQWAPPAQPGLVICNPPYGKRVGKDEDLPALYRTFGTTLKKDFPGWRVAFICPDERLARATGLVLRKQGTLQNGGIAVSLWTAEL